MSEPSSPGNNTCNDGTQAEVEGNGGGGCDGGDTCSGS